MLAETEETALWAFSTCDAATDDADEAASATEELATDMTDSIVP
jgi:hypothetical protein